MARKSSEAEERPETLAARETPATPDRGPTQTLTGSDTQGGPEKRVGLGAPPSLVTSPAQAQPSDTGGGEKTGGGLDASGLVDDLVPGPAQASSNDTPPSEKQGGGLDASGLVES